MADVHTKKQRSYNMSRIKGKDTKPEMLVRKFLHANGFRYKLHDKKMPGKPDVFGMGMRDVNILKYRRPERNGGRIK